MSEALMESPLKTMQEELGAKFVSFGGWNLPVSYEKILDEYWAVRRRAGLFDVSHMGRFSFTGRQSGRLLDTLLTHHIATLKAGQGRYSVMCRPDGGIIDDVICYRLAEEEYLLVVNGATRQKDWNWIEHFRAERFPEVNLTDHTLATAMVALQGPAALELLIATLDCRGMEKKAKEISRLRRFRVVEVRAGSPIPLLVSMTGYTGEPGVELIGAPEKIKPLWTTLVEAGARPAGLGARDLLRLEMGYLLPGLKRQDITRAAFEVPGLADQTAGQLPDEFPP